MATTKNERTEVHCVEGKHGDKGFTHRVILIGSLKKAQKLLADMGCRRAADGGFDAPAGWESPAGLRVKYFLV